MSVAHPPEPPAVADSFTIWAMDCPFRKAGSPVLGTMGSSIRRVIVIEMDEWQRMNDAIPQLATTQFRVGTYDE